MGDADKLTEPDWRFEYNERAAILEYEAGLPRDEAENKAKRITNEMLREWRRRNKLNDHRDTR